MPWHRLATNISADIWAKQTQGEKLTLALCVFEFELDGRCRGAFTPPRPVLPTGPKEIMLLPQRLHHSANQRRCIEPLLQAYSGFCRCRVTLGVREWASKVNVSCNHEPTLNCRQVCVHHARRELRRLVWTHSAAEKAAVGQLAASRYRSRVQQQQQQSKAARCQLGNCASRLDSTSSREAVVFATRVLDANSTPRCVWETLLALAKATSATRQFIILAESGCTAPALARFTPITPPAKPPLCILASQLANGTDGGFTGGYWAAFNGKSGSSKGGFIRWLASSTKYDRAWLVEDDIHLAGGGWSNLFDDYIHTPAELISLSPTGEVVQGNIELGRMKAFECVAAGRPCLAVGRSSLVKSYLQLARFSHSFAAELAQALDKGFTRGHHENSVAAACEQSPTCAHTVISRCASRSGESNTPASSASHLSTSLPTTSQYLCADCIPNACTCPWHVTSAVVSVPDRHRMGYFTSGVLTGVARFKFKDQSSKQPGKLYHPAKCKAPMFQLVTRHLRRCVFEFREMCAGCSKICRDYISEHVREQPSNNQNHNLSGGISNVRRLSSSANPICVSAMALST